MKRVLLLSISVLLLTSMEQNQSISKNELLGQFEPSKHADFVRIDAEYTDKPSIYLRKATYQAFKDMYWEAKKCGINLKIRSATRNFNYQKGIWERKFARPKYKGWQAEDIVRDIMKYSSMPGTSRHHWGTDIDFNSFENSFFESGKGKRIYDWLIEFGPEYGFYQVYTSKENGRKGYEEEKWHWTYLPLSKGYLEEYKKQVSYDDITGFKGAKEAIKVKAIENYVGGINPEILN